MCPKSRLGVLGALFLAVLINSGCASSGSRRSADPFLPSQSSQDAAPAWKPAPVQSSELKPAQSAEQKKPETVVTLAPEATPSQAAPESFGLKASADEKSSVQIVPSKDVASDTLALTPARACWLIGGAAVVLAIAGFVLLRK